MPVKNFNDQTFVAFIDIMGFKELMKQRNKALQALERLYQAGYDVIKESYDPTKESNDIDGIFVSDCGILFSRHIDNVEGFKVLLDKIKKINRTMLDSRFLTATSLAFGEFRYQERIEIQGIGKNLFFGDAYVEAFLDVEETLPKIKAGLCRIVKNGLPEIVTNYINQKTDSLTQLIGSKPNDPNHYYFYWNLEQEYQIENFEKKYNDSYSLFYDGIINSLKADND